MFMPHPRDATRKLVEQLRRDEAVATSTPLSLDESFPNDSVRLHEKPGAFWSYGFLTS